MQDYIYTDIHTHYHTHRTHIYILCIRVSVITMPTFSFIANQYPGNMYSRFSITSEIFEEMSTRFYVHSDNLWQGEIINRAILCNSDLKD